IPQNILINGNAGTWQTLDDTFADIVVNFNYITLTLNKDTGTGFKNYKQISDVTSIETIVLSVNSASKQITTIDTLDFVVGPLIIYKSISSTFTYSPVTFKDTLNLKQVSEATLMFENKAFSNATLSFKSDLVPQ